MAAVNVSPTPDIIDLCDVDSGYTHFGLASSHRFRRFLHVKQPDRDHLPPSRLYLFFVDAA